MQGSVEIVLNAREFRWSLTPPMGFFVAGQDQDWGGGVEIGRMGDQGPMLGLRLNRLSVEGLPSYLAAICTTRAVLLFGRQVIPAVGGEILFHPIVSARRVRRLLEKRGIRAPGEATEQRQNNEQYDRHILSDFHSVSPQTNSAVILSLDLRRCIDNAQSSQNWRPRGRSPR